MVSVISLASPHPWYKHMTMIMIVCASTVMASDAPPAKLPRGFLEQLPLLIQFSEKEFELLLIFSEENNANNRRVKKSGDESMLKPPYDTSDKSKMGEHDENLSISNFLQFVVIRSVQYYRC